MAGVRADLLGSEASHHRGNRAQSTHRGAACHPETLLILVLLEVGKALGMGIVSGVCLPKSEYFSDLSAINRKLPGVVDQIKGGPLATCATGSPEDPTYLMCHAWDL